MGKFRQSSFVVDAVWSSSALIDSLTSRSEVFIFAYSPLQKTLLSWSANALQILGVKDASIARDGNLFLRHVHPDDRFLLMTDLEEALNGQADYRATYRWIRPDNNELRWLHCRGALTGRGKEETFEGVIVDLTDEFTGQVGKVAGPDSVPAILAAFPTMVFTLDKDLRILRLNRPPNMLNFNFGDQYFKSENFKIGRSFLNAFSSEEYKKNFAKLLGDLIESKTNFHRSRISLNEFVFNMEISPLLEKEGVEGLLFVISDVTEIVSLERQISQLQKSEGLRLLAAGVSHNFNNSLQSIIGQASIIKNHPDKTALILEASQAIIDTVNRASEMARQLFTEPGDRKLLREIDINIAAMSAVNKLEGIFSSGVKVSVAFGTPAAILAEQEKIEEVITALLKNAHESMPNGGDILIKTQQVNLSNNEVQDLPAKSYVKLIISDTGSGMTEKIKAQATDPFFTTKERDLQTGVNLKGGGLGLSNAYSIARELGGILTIESKEGRGTTVTMYIPVAESRQPDTRLNDFDNHSEDNSAAEILIIDDDKLVLQTSKQILTDAGFTCAVAEDSVRAINMIKRHKKSIKLLLVDAVMSGMDGASLLMRLKRYKPDIKAIGFSGASDAATKSLRDAGAEFILKKPVDAETLKRAVKSVIEQLQAA